MPSESPPPTCTDAQSEINLSNAKLKIASSLHDLFEIGCKTNNGCYMEFISQLTQFTMQS